MPTLMEDGATGNWADRLEIGLLFVAFFGATFVLPVAIVSSASGPSLALAGLPALASASLGIASLRSRPRLGAALLLAVTPVALAFGAAHAPSPRGTEGVGRELSVAVTAIAYFLGTGRALGGPGGRLPAGPAQPALLGASALLVAFGLAGAALADEATFSLHFGESAREARFLGSALSLAIASLTLLSVGPSLARRPTPAPRPPQQLVGRLVLYASLATVGLMLLARIT